VFEFPAALAKSSRSRQRRIAARAQFFKLSGIDLLRQNRKSGYIQRVGVS
jgi:hypothetical protein